MAMFDASKHNKKLIDEIQKAIDGIVVTGKNLDDDNVSIINGIKVPTDEKDRLKKLIETLELLDIHSVSRDSLFVFEELAVDSKKFDDLMLLLKSDLGIEVPSIINFYGIIPGLNIKTPRPMLLAESMDNYEAYLKSYYHKNGYDVTVDDNGLRSPYPHEKYLWKKGEAVKPDNDDYVCDYYKKYIEVHRSSPERNTEPQNTDPEPEPTAPRAEAGRRHYVKSRRSLKDKILNLPHDINQNLKSEEFWTNVKKVLKTVGIIAGIVVLGTLAVKVLGPALVGAAKGISYIPGAVAAAGGASTIYSAAQVARIRSTLSLLGITAVGVTLVALYRRYRKKVLDRAKDGEEPTTSTTPTNNGNGPQNEPTGTPNFRSKEEVDNYFKTKLAENKKKLEELDIEEKMVKENSTSPEEMETALNSIKTRREILERTRSQILEMQIKMATFYADFQNVRPEEAMGGMSL